MSTRVEPADLGIKRLLTIFCALAVLLLALLAYVPLESRNTEWRAFQTRYNALARSAGLPEIPVEIRQIYLPELRVADRCGSCHLAAAGAGAPIPGQPLFAAHPPIPHDPHELGCTVCHGGQGRGTTMASGHGEGPSWDEPILPEGSAEAGCGTCHSSIRVPKLDLARKGRDLFAAQCRSCHAPGKPGVADLEYVGLHGFRPDWHGWHVQQAGEAKAGPFTAGFAPLADDEVAEVAEYLLTRIGAPRLLEGKALAYESGCLGCHKIGGVGGDDGPDLSDEGNRLPADLDFTHVTGPHTVQSWQRAHFLAPAVVSPGSRMPKLGLTPPQADQLTLYMLSLRKREIPEAMAPRDRLRGLRLGERDFATDGASLFGVFCAGCHGAAGQGRKLEGQPAPAIMNPEVLAILDDATLRRTITEGRPGRRMPAWGKSGLKPEEIDALVAYLRSRLPAPPSLAGVEAAPADPGLGRATYLERCAPCHGERGEGSAVAPPLSAKDNPVTRADDRIYGTVSAGVAGTAMGAFPGLDPATMHAVIAWVRSLPRLPVSRSAWSAKPGEAGRGAQVYATDCARCHGKRGEGPLAPALANPAFQRALSDGQMTATVLRGRPGTEMPAFGRAGPDHRRLTPDQVADVIAFIRTIDGRPPLAAGTGP